MIGLLSTLMIALAVVTVAVVAAAGVVGVQAISLYRQGLAVRDDVLPHLDASRKQFDRLGACSTRIRQTLSDQWQRMKPAVDEIERESTHTLSLWKRASARAGDEARKTRSDLRIVQAAL